MVQTRLERPRTSTLETTSEKTSRLHFVDTLRTALVMLVVLHHVALIYGAGAPFYYVEPPFTEPLTFLLLLVFILVNQSWFMGAFFLLAGYFTPGSFERKGAGLFLKDRLLRLGIPLLVFYFVLNPLSSLATYLMPPSLTGITTPPSWEAYPKLIGMGPMWFVAMLLIFSGAYAAWRSLTRNRTPSQRASTFPGYLRISVFMALLAALSYLLRMVIPLGKTVLGFPTLAYLPQYLSFFIVGTVASQRDWLRNSPSAKGIAGFIAAFAAGVVLFPLAFSGELFSLELSETLSNAMGNGHWQSAMYALWDSVFAVGICLALISAFRYFFNRAGTFSTFLARHSYTVYIIHIPLIVYLAFLFRGVEVGSLVKVAGLSAVAVPLCFIAAYLIRKLPFARRIL